MNRISIKAVRDAPVLPEKDSPKRASLLPEILDRLKDPNVAVSQIIHLIAIEIAGIADAMRKNEEATNPRSESKSPVEQVKVLRLLSRTLVESYVPDTRDVLDMDGPKFAFVFSKILDCFKDALVHATKKPIGDFLNQIIIKEFADLIKERQQDIQREINHPKFSYHVDRKVPDR
jgi:hypothetical protein